VTTSRVAQILATLAGEPGGQSVPDRLCRSAAAQVPVGGASLSVMNQIVPAGTIAASDSAVALLEELQFSLREGPCVDAATWRRPVLEPDLRLVSAGRWPGLLPALADTPIRAVFAFPLQIGQIRLGVMDLYRDRPGMLSHPELDTALAYADAATSILLTRRDDGGDADEVPDLLLDPVRHRAQVHQATGMVMVQAGVTIEEAFHLLIARSYADERPLIDLAADVVARRVRFAPVVDNGPDGAAGAGGDGSGGSRP